MATSATAHILVFPFPAQGHMLPLLNLTHQLALRRPNLTITILITPKNLPILNPLLTTHPSIQTLILPFPNHPSIPLGIENVKDLPSSYFRPMIHALSQLHDPLHHWIKSLSSSSSSSSPLTAILSDFFLGWTHDLASHLRIPRIVFSPSGSYVLSISAWTWRDLPKRSPDHTMDDNAVIKFPKVPNSPSYPWCQISSLYRMHVEGDPVSEFIRDCMLSNLASWGFVFNSFDELERAYLEHMREDVNVRRVWAVGPLLPFSDSNDAAATTSPSFLRRGGPMSDSDVLSWLDTCGDRSVVFICFGSQVVLTNEQMEEVADALERSGVNFLWSTKEPTGIHVEEKYGLVPAGFEERVEGRGRVIRGWAPQVLILRHRAVGSFLTHCGWNSVLESVVGGVPMLSWPMGADQYMNATLVEEVGVATRVCEGEGTIPNAAEFAHALGESVSERNIEKRERAIALSKAALSAVKEGGSSCRDLDRLVRDLCGVTLESRD